MLLPKRVTTMLVAKAKPALNRAHNVVFENLKTSSLTPMLVAKAKPALSLAHKLVPTALQNQLVLQGMKRLSKEFLENGEMDFMSGKVARLHIKDMNISYFFTLQGPALNSTQDGLPSARLPDKKLTILHSGHSLSGGQPHDPESDVTFSASLEAFVLLASQKVDPDTLFFNRSLQISGDTELGLEIKNLIDQFDIQLLHKPVGQVLNLWSQQLLENQHA